MQQYRTLLKLRRKSRSGNDWSTCYLSVLLKLIGIEKAPRRSRRTLSEIILPASNYLPTWYSIA